MTAASDTMRCGRYTLRFNDKIKLGHNGDKKERIEET